jgi:fatty acid desaturase
VTSIFDFVHAAGNSSHLHHHKKASNADDIEKAFRDLFKQNTHEFNILLNVFFTPRAKGVEVTKHAAAQEHDA